MVNKLIKVGFFIFIIFIASALSLGNFIYPSNPKQGIIIFSCGLFFFWLIFWKYDFYKKLNNWKKKKNEEDYS